MNDLRSVIPPGFNERASTANQARVYSLSIPLMYSNKNPSWQQLTINEADALEPDVVMQKLNQDELFAPDTEDVMLLEREVNVYRSRMRDDEMDNLQDQRRLLMQQLQEGNIADDLDDQLRELDARIRARQLELDETERRRLQLEEENRRLEIELSRQPPRPAVVHHITTVVAPAPVPVRAIAVEPVRQRSRSPNINILPQKIANLPAQRMDRSAYNYTNRDNPLFASGQMSDGDFYNVSHSPSPIIPPRPMQPTTTFAQQNYPQPMLGQSIPTTQPMYSTQSGNTNSTTVINKIEQRVSGAYSSGYPPSNVAPISGATYKINGQTFTDANLPTAYAHLRQ